MRTALAIVVVGVAAAAAVSVSARQGGPPAWNARAAASYLDGELEWWSTWPNAARDHGTFCVSCHTVAPYAVARPALAGALGERTEPKAARTLYEKVCVELRNVGLEVATGRFAAHMHVVADNDGPVTFVIVTRSGAIV